MDGPGDRRFTFCCACCGHRFPDYYRGVFLFGVALADHCVECEYGRRVDVHQRRDPQSRDVAAYIAAGYTQREIADAWGVSTRTVKRVLARARRAVGLGVPVS